LCPGNAGSSFSNSNRSAEDLIRNPGKQEKTTNQNSFDGAEGSWLPDSKNFRDKKGSSFPDSKQECRRI
jgi:hypothetical protein